jgi:hypothetical protein
MRREPMLDVQPWVLPVVVVAISVPILAAWLVAGPVLGILAAGIVGAALAVVAIRLSTEPLSRRAPRRSDHRLDTARMPKRILALVSEPVSGEALKKAVGPDRAKGAEVLVVAPALNTRTRFWLSDVDAAIKRAEEVQEETVDRMVQEGVDAAGDTGESDPLLAIQDALQTFPADEIVLFTHAGGELNWLEEGVVEEARDRFELPVDHLIVGSP